MLQADSWAAVHSEVLSRVFDLARHGLNRPLAESLLQLDFSNDDAERIMELNGRANEGTLTEPEEAELQGFINIGDLLALWQSKARHLLTQTF